MKRVCTIFLLLISSLSFAKNLESRIKIDIDGRKTKINIKTLNKPGLLKGVYPKWLKGDTRKQYLCFNSYNLSTKWKTFRFSFIPQKSGKLKLAIRSNFQDRKLKNIRYTDYRNFKLEGAEGKNLNFKIAESGRFKFWGGGSRAFVFSDNGNYVQCQHDFRIYQFITVVKGQTVKVEFQAKAGKIVPRKRPKAKKKPLSYYRYHNNKVKLLPLKDKGLSAQTVLRMARKKRLKPTRPKPYPVFHAKLKSTRKGNVDCVSVPIELLEESNIDRNAFVRFGFPLPKGALYHLDNVRVLNHDGKKVQTQFAATVFWKDKSVKWLLVQFMAPLKAKEKTVYKIEFGNNVKAYSYKSNLKLTEDQEKIIVTTGSLKALINKKEFNLIDKIWIDKNKDGKFSEKEFVGGFGSKGIKIVDENLKPFYSAIRPPEKIRIEEEGKEKIVVKIDGKFYAKNSSGPYMSYSIRLTFINNSEFVSSALRIINTNIKNEFTDFTSIELPFESAAKIEQVQALLDGNKSIKEKLTGTETIRIFQKNDLLLDIDGEKETKDKLTGAFMLRTDNGIIAAALRDCWQRWPKAVKVSRNKFTIELLPTLPNAKFAHKLPHYLQYPFCEGKHRLKWGMSFTEELTMNFAETASIKLVNAETNLPVVATIPLEWHAKAKAFPGITFPNGKQFSEWDAYVKNTFKAHMKLKVKQREYGHLNYGDWFGERNKNWGNNEYDLAHGLFMDFIRTGNRNHYRWALKAALHQADVDCVHAYPDPYYLGANHQHSIGHTGNWSSHHKHSQWTHAYDAHTAARNGHTWMNGMLKAWALSGNPRPMAASYGIGEHIIWAAAPSFRKLGTHERTAGWMLKAILAICNMSNDPHYMKAADKIANIALKEQKFNKGGAWPHKLPPDHAGSGGYPKAYGNAPFLIGVLLSSLKSYHEINGKPEVKRSIVSGVNWLTKAWDKNANAWPYTASVSGEPYFDALIGSSNILISNSVAYAANLTNRKDLNKLSEKAVSAITLTKVQVRSGGKGFAQMMFFMPEVLCEIQKWHLKNSPAKGKLILAGNNNRLFFDNFPDSDSFKVRSPDEKFFFAKLKSSKAVLEAVRTKHGSRKTSVRSGTIKIKTQNDKTVAKDTFSIKKAWSKKYTLKGKTGDIFTIDINDNRTSKWNLKSNKLDIVSKVNSGFRIGGVGISKYYIYVPKGTKNFSIKITGAHRGYYGAQLRQPDEKIAAKYRGVNTGGLKSAFDKGKKMYTASKILWIKVPENMDGKAWKLFLWAAIDMAVQLNNIPPYLSLKKNAILNFKNDFSALSEK